MKALIAGVTLLAAPLAPSATPGEGGLTASLHVRRSAEAERCIEASALSAAVEERLERRVFVRDRTPDLHVNLELAKVRKGWQARLLLEDSAGNELGRREIVTTARDCSALDASLALVVALLVDAPPIPPVPVERREQASKSAPPPRPATPLALPRDTHAPREPFRFDVRGSALAAVGLLPGIAPGAALSLSLLPPHFLEFALSAEMFLPRRVDAGAGRGLELRHFRFGVSVCPLSHETPGFRVAGCAGQTVGRMDARGFGFDQSATVKDLSYGLTLGPDFRLRLGGPWGLGFALAAEFPLTRNRYVSEPGHVTLFRAAPVAASARVGVSAEL